MQKRLAAIAAALLLAAGSASADPGRYVLDLAGSGMQSDAPHDFAWTGSVTIVTDSTADGLYSYGDLVSFTLDSTLGGFVSDGAVDPFLQVGQEVTISGGQVATIEGGYSPDHFAKFMFDGLGVSYTVSDCTDCNLVNASAVLSPVPEPATVPLWAAGLAAAVLAGRRKGRASV
jgi:hypothetical protein